MWEDCFGEAEEGNWGEFREFMEKSKGLERGLIAAAEEKLGNEPKGLVRKEAFLAFTMDHDNDIK